MPEGCTLTAHEINYTNIRPAIIRIGFWGPLHSKIVEVVM